MVDTGACQNILYYRCFKKMGLNDHHLKPNSMVLEGFTAHKIQTKCTVRPEVTLGSEGNERTEEIKFHVVDIDSSYDAILGTLLLSSFDLVVSTSYQRVKFLTKDGVGCVRTSPKNLFNYQMTSKKLLAEETSAPMEIGVIQVA